MSDDPNKQNDDDASAGNEPNIKALREAAEAGKTARQENEQLKRELAFARAGIDTSTKLGGMLSKTWDGDLDDVDALKAEWAELNPQGNGSTNNTEDAPTPPGFQDPAQQQEHREKVTGSGAPAGGQEPTTKDPIELAYERYHGDISRGVPIADAQEGAITTILESFFKGDKRVMFDKNAFREQARRAAEGDLAT